MKKLKEPSVKIGDVFGGLTVIDTAEPRKKNRYWKCRCVCGNIVEKYHGHLASGSTVSCGCRKTHTNDAWHELIKHLHTSHSKTKPKKNSAEENLIQVKLASEDFVRLVDADAPVWLVWVKEILGYPDHVDYDTLATYPAPHLAELDAVVSLIRRADPNMSLYPTLGQRAQTLILTSEGPLPRDWWKETLSEHARRIGEHWNKYAGK